MASDGSFLSSATWLNEPPEWRVHGSGIEMVTGDMTDFWQDTFYGFQKDDGHFFGRKVEGDFSAEVTFEGEYVAQYDQAGLMLRSDANHWLKAGVEYSDKVTNFSVVVTRTRSDWSVVSASQLLGAQKVRLTRIGGALMVHYRSRNGRWSLLRLTDFPYNEEVWLGIFACSPCRSGFRACFSDFLLGPPVPNPLHGED